VAIGELGKESVDRVIEAQRTLLGEQQGQRRENRFRVRADPYLSIDTQRIVTGWRSRSKRFDGRLAAVSQTDDSPWHNPGLDKPTDRSDQLLGLHPV
jgi:hypothetical protein